jgi:glucose dehydrogenase
VTRNRKISAAKSGLIATVAVAAAALAFSASAPDVRAQDNLNTISQNDADWVMAANNYSITRFSKLKQINAGNVSRLTPAWTFSLGVPHGEEGAPLVVDGTLYVMSAYPNKVFALDAATGDLKWTYLPNGRGVGREDRQGAMGRQDRRHQPRPDHHHGAPDRPRQNPHRQ